MGGSLLAAALLLIKRTDWRGSCPQTCGEIESEDERHGVLKATQ
jgi:hypothetical protein